MNDNDLYHEKIKEAYQGSSDSMLYVAKSFFDGSNGFPKNVEAGLVYLSNAISLNNIEAIQLYGSMLFNGNIIPKDEDNANDILMTVITKYNNPHAKLILALIQFSHRTFSNDKGFDDANVNYVQAKKFSKEAADSDYFHGIDKAMLLYGMLCQKQKNNKFGSIERDFNESFKYLKRAADLGNSEAMVYVGDIYNYGYGVVEMDKEKACQYYKASKDLGSMSGYAAYGGHLIETLQENEEEAFRYIKISCDQNNPRGQVNYGYFLYTGIKVLNFKQNRKESVKYFKMANDAGYHVGINDYALFLRDGNYGVTRDLDKAIHYFKLAISEGSIPSARHLGFMYSQGIKDSDSNFIFQPNLAEAKKYLKYASDYCDPYALEEYISVLNDDIEELKKYLELGIKLKNSYAITYYGAALLDGDIVPKNEIDAARYIKMAVDKGETYAMFMYAQIHEQGLGVNIDLVKARKYYKKAAELGCTDAIESYIKFLEEGIGGDQFLSEANKYREIIEKK